MVSERAALASRDNGLCVAKPCNQPGMVAGSTKTLEAKARGNIHTNPAPWTASGSFSARPM